MRMGLGNGGGACCPPLLGTRDMDVTLSGIVGTESPQVTTTAGLSDAKPSPGSNQPSVLSLLL